MGERPPSNKEAGRGVLLQQLPARVSPSYRREQLCPHEKIHSYLTGRQVTPATADKQLDPLLESDGLCSFYRVSGSLRRDPILKICPVGGHVALTETKQNS